MLLFASTNWLLALASVVGVSLLSFIGLASLGFDKKTFAKAIPFIVSFAAGALLGDVFFHMLPEAAENGFGINLTLGILGGIIFSFILEKVIHWHHCHQTGHNHIHPVGYINLAGEGIHNFIDGMIIGASYLISVDVGIATTVAVILHEIPREFGGFAILVHAGFTRTKALLYNFLSGIAALLGLALAWVGSNVGIADFLIPFAAGNFIYIALADLVPELNKEQRAYQSTLQLFLLIAGVAAMSALLLLE